MAGVPRGRGRQQWVTRETLGPDGRGPRLGGPTAAWTLRLWPPVADTFSLHRATFEDGAAGPPRVRQACIAVGAAGAHEGRDVDDPRGWARVTGLAPCPRGARLCTLPLEGRSGWGMGLNRWRGRGGRRAEKPRGGLPLRVAELLPKRLERRSAPSELRRFLQALGTPLESHPHARPTPNGQPPCAHLRRRAGLKGVEGSVYRRSGPSVSGGRVALTPQRPGLARQDQGRPAGDGRGPRKPISRAIQGRSCAEFASGLHRPRSLKGYPGCILGESRKRPDPRRPVHIHRIHWITA